MVRNSSKKRAIVVANETRNQEDHIESIKMGVNKWLDLPSCLFEKIFANLNPMDALLIIPLVCKDWGRLLLEILFFKENNHLNLIKLMDGHFNSIFNRLEDEELREMKLMKIIVGLMHAFASDDQSDTYAVRTNPIVEISFTSGLPFHDRHLIYIAKRYIYYPPLFCYIVNLVNMKTSYNWYLKLK